jgi:hypothetical protein
VDVRDESTEEVRVVLELRAEGDEAAAMAFLCKHTPLQTNFPLNRTCLVPAEEAHLPGRPERLPLREVLRLCGAMRNVRRIYYSGFHNNDPKQIFQSSLSYTEAMETAPASRPSSSPTGSMASPSPWSAAVPCGSSCPGRMASSPSNGSSASP